MRVIFGMDLKTIQTYNEKAADYDQETIEFWDTFPKSFLDTFSKLSQGKVLNVGSGPGRDALLLKERGLDVTCLDASTAMIKLCQDRGLEAVLADFNDIPFSEGSFGGVWAYTSFLHTPKTEISKALNETKRVLKDGGIFALGLIEGDFEGYRESSGVSLPRWFSFYSQEEVEQLLKEHGFEVLYFETFKPASRNYLNFIARKI